MTGRCIALVAAAAAVACGSRDQQRAVNDELATFQECYELTYAEWSPPLRPQDAASFLPPRFIALTRVPAPEQREGPWYRRFPDRHRLDLKEPVPWADWKRAPGNGVTIAWSDGFMGSHTQLMPAGRGFTGHAETFSDAPGGRHRASAAMSPIDCRSRTEATS